MQPLDLDDRKYRDLEGLIRKSFRVRENMTPIYVDIGGNLARVSLDQHQIVFGRRGSGKSTLLLYFRRKEAPKASIHTIYINADTVKTLDYPDALIRILLSIFENLPRRRAIKWLGDIFRRRNPIRQTTKELRTLLSRPSTSRTRQVEGSERKVNRVRSGRFATKRLEMARSADRTYAERGETTREYDEYKVQTIDNRLPDYKERIQNALSRSRKTYSALIIDDFYLIHRDIQPDVIDYIHRLLRDADLYFKIGTVTHRSNLLRTSPVHIGIQPRVDVDALSLDQTLEDLDQTRGYLEEMLRLMGKEVGIDEAPLAMTDEARRNLVLLSGGVPRDYLNVFVGGLERARRIKNRRQITPTDLRRSAAAQVQETKLPELRRDGGDNIDALEALFATLIDFCLLDRKKTAFLISEAEAQQRPEAHELIKQLMDCRLIHIVEPNTSAASGRPGRYEAYTLDFGLFMEPRKRNIEIVEFWETDDQRRRVRLREAPVFPLERAEAAITGETKSTAEQALKIAKSIENDSRSGELRLFS